MVHNAALKASIAIVTEMFVGLQQDTRKGQSDAENWKCVVDEFQKITVAIGLPHHISVSPADIFHRCVRKMCLETTDRRFEIYNVMREWPEFSCNILRAYFQDRTGAGLPGGDHGRSKNASLTLPTVTRDNRQPRDNVTGRFGLELDCISIAKGQCGIHVVPISLFITLL